MTVFVSRYANPIEFQRIANVAAPAAGIAAIALAAIGLYLGLAASPPDYQQGDTVRIMYVHVPAAWMALGCYTALAVASLVGFVWRHPLADVAARSTAPIGLVFTGLALITGAIWGRPTWGAWWAWDARLTSVLVLFFLYAGYMALWSVIDDKTRAARVAAIAALVGFVNIPIIKFSVEWWNSLHQQASILRAGGPSVDGSMLTPLLLMGGAYLFLTIWFVLRNMEAELAERRIHRLEATAAAPSRVVAVEQSGPIDQVGQLEPRSD